MLRVNHVLMLLMAAALLYSCAGDNGQTEQQDGVAEDSVAQTEQALSKIDRNMVYKLPSPVELYTILKSEDVAFNNDALNSVENADKYVTKTSKALNFGIYASDLAYCTVFGVNQETFVYFNTAKQIADDLGLTEGFDQEMAERIDKNINNSDSLYQITTDSYWSATQHLEKNDQTNILPLIITGAWLESVYIAIHSVPEFNEEDPTVVRIAEQQLLLENLIDYIHSIDNNEVFVNILNQLEDLQMSFDQLYDNVEEIITKEQYEEISAKIIALRNELVG